MEALILGSSKISQPFVLIITTGSLVAVRVCVNKIVGVIQPAKAIKNKKMIALLEETIQVAELKAKKEQEEAKQRAKALEEPQHKEQQ